jgi:hypothetical protein
MNANPHPIVLEIILSARAQKRWKIKPALRAAEPPAHWLGQWRIDFGQKADRTWLALVTNVATLYTFVFPLAQLGRRDFFERSFRQRLGVAIASAPSLAPWKNAPLVFVSGNPRMVVGSMNDMRRNLPWHPEIPVGPRKKPEDWINETPYLSLPTAFPEKEFAARLAEAKRSESP